MTKIYLILSLMAPGLPTVTYESIPYPSQISCAQALENAIDAWFETHSEPTGVGAIGRCSDKPLKGVRI